MKSKKKRNTRFANAKCSHVPNNVFFFCVLNFPKNGVNFFKYQTQIESNELLYIIKMNIDKPFTHGQAVTNAS